MATALDLFHPLSAPDWLATIESSSVACVILDPPYSMTPNSVRGRDDGAAGTSGSPYRLFVETLRETRRILRDGGIAAVVCDWRRFPDVAYLGSTSGLRLATTIAWTRNRPGTGGLFRGAWDPVLIFAKGTPLAIDRAAIRNWVNAECPSKRSHPYEKPVALWSHILQRIPTGLVVDPFCGSGASRPASLSLGHSWKGFDCDPFWLPGEAE